MNKILFLICDGLSDRPIPELGEKTPLESANKPNIDKITKRAITGLMHTVGVGIRPGSDVAHLCLFGYEVNKYYPGRGPFEAAGYGLDIKADDVAFRGNFATVDKNLKILDRRAGRISKTSQLIKEIKKVTLPEVEILIKKGNGHRLALALRGKGLDGRISDVDPHENKRSVLLAKPLSSDKNSLYTARLVNTLLNKYHSVLKDHPFNKKREKQNLPPANYVLLRGAGKLPLIPSFKDKYHLKSACIAGAGLYKGIAKILGMDIINNIRFTGMIDSNINGKIKLALSLFKKYDFVFIHIKAADNLAEDGDFHGKTAFIEKIDRALKPLVKRKDIYFVLTADHTTSSRLKKHTADPVPILIAGGDIPIDNINFFGERSVAQGNLGHIKGKHLMPILMDYLGLSPMKGA